MMNFPRKNSPRSRAQAGFTLSELLISIFLISLLSYGVSSFMRNTFFYNTTIRKALNSQFEVRQTLKKLSAELRAASQASDGSYALAEASSTSLTFYTDLNGDGVKERLRYFLSGTTLRRGVIIPSGSPLTYNSGSETVSDMVHYRVGTTSIFTYYDSGYAATTTPLSQPVTVSAVRLVQAAITVNPDPGRQPNVSFTSKVSLRNLKDNL